MKARRVVLLIFGLFILLALSAPHQARAQVQRAPILIAGNDGFTPANGVNGGGDGSPGNPYIIENWAIDASGGNGIEIRDTTAYFIVRNCLVENGYRYGSYFGGVVLRDVRNGKIENNSFSNGNWFGIELVGSSNIVISNNSILRNASHGIFLANSSSNALIGNTSSNNYFSRDSANGIYLVAGSNRNVVENNVTKNNGDSGIYLYLSSNYNTITNNITRNNVNCGIYLRESSNNNLLSNNVSENNWAQGIKLLSSSSNTLTNNAFKNNLAAGIKLQDSSNNSLVGNVVENNCELGINNDQGFGAGIFLVLSSNNNLLFYNNLIGNMSEGNAYDEGINFWDNNGRGNYWSDWQIPDANGDGIVDTARLIAGGNNQDKYPLVINKPALAQRPENQPQPLLPVIASQEKESKTTPTPTPVPAPIPPTMRAESVVLALGIVTVALVALLRFRAGHWPWSSRRRKKAVLLLMSFALLVLIALSPSGKSLASARVETANGLNITWRLTSDGISHKQWEITVQNLTTTSRTIDLSAVFSQASFNINGIKNVKFYEWKSLPTMGLVLDYDNVRHEVPRYDGENKLIGYENVWIWEAVGSHFENMLKNSWKPCKMQFFQTSATSYKEGFESMNLPKFGSKPTYDNYGNLETENGKKTFRLEFDVPIGKTSKGYGSFGLVNLEIDGVRYGSDYVGELGSSWWDSSWLYRKQITINGTRPDNFQHSIVLSKVDNLDNKCRIDFGDIRFTDNAATPHAELSYVLDNFITDNRADFWFRQIENDTQAWIYYGNTSATTTSDNDATFIAYDNFVTAGRWTDNSSYASVTGDNLNLTSFLRGQGGQIYKQITLSSDFILDFEINMIGLSGNFGFNIGVGDDIGFLGEGPFHPQNGMVAEHIGASAGSVLNAYAGTLISGTYARSSGNTWSLNTIYYCRLMKIGTALMYAQYTSKSNRNDNSNPGLYLVKGTVPSATMKYLYGISSDGGADTTTISGRIDEMILRKYATGITYTLGAAETANVAPNQPMGILPSARQTTSNVTLSAVGTDNDNDRINLFFYDNATKTAIDNVWIENGGTASVIWTGRARGQTYVFFARAQDNNSNWGENSGTQTFKVNALAVAENLKIGGSDAPTRLTTLTPGLTWAYYEPDSGDVIDNYRLQVGTSLGDNSLWDRNTSIASSVTYAGAALSRGVTYFVRVRVHDNFEWGGWENDTFRVNQLPTCSITAPASGLTVGIDEGIAFTSSASDPDLGDSITYAWDFGDNGTSTLANTSHSYPNAGGYTVTLKVNDGYENSAEDLVAINVTEGGGPSGPSGGPSDGGGWVAPFIAKVKEEIVGIVQPPGTVNILFLPLLSLPVLFWLMTGAGLMWAWDQKGISKALLIIAIFLVFFGAKITPGGI